MMNLSRGGICKEITSYSKGSFVICSPIFINISLTFNIYNFVYLKNINKITEYKICSPQTAFKNK